MTTEGWATYGLPHLIDPHTPTPNSAEKRNEGMTARYSRLRAVFDVGTALLLADAGFDVIGYAPVQDSGVAS